MDLEKACGKVNKGASSLRHSDTLLCMKDILNVAENFSKGSNTSGGMSERFQMNVRECQCCVMWPWLLDILKYTTLCDMKARWGDIGVPLNRGETMEVVTIVVCK